MPKSKLHLIADENRGGFPNSKRSEVVEPRKHDMKPPSLVARLMGLEAMPAIQRDKPKKKSSVSQIHKNFLEDELISKSNAFSREEESGFEKSRPQKMQRTTAGVCNRRVVKRFGSEALQIKNVLTRARKHHQYVHQHQKLASPVKSPRLYRRSSRLIDAATRILEPGLQANRNRAKRAIVYSGSRPSVNVMTDSAEVVSPVSVGFQRGCHHMASCKKCGSLVDVLGSGSGVEGTGKNFADVPESSTGRNFFQGIRSRNEVQTEMFERERLPTEAQLRTLHSMGASSSAAHIASFKGKDFVGMKHGPTCRNRPRISRKNENSDLDLQRRSYIRFDDSSPSRLGVSARKRRIASVSGGQRSDGNATCAGKRAGGSAESAFVPVRTGSSTRGNHRSYRESKERQRVQCNSNQTVENHLKMPLQKRLPMDGDSIGVLLPRKLKEVISQEQDKVIRVGALAGKSTSSMLQDWISALAYDQQTIIERTDTHQAETTHRSKGKRRMWSLGHEHNGDYMSPGSVLEASFSNESCFSNSVDDSPGQIRLPLEPTDHLLNPSEPDFGLLEDSATSTKKQTPINYQWITNLINHASSLLRSLNDKGLRSTRHKFIYAREVIILTEIFFSASQGRSFFISPKLLNELVIHATRSELPLYLPRFTRGFLVDAMIEYLDLRYCEQKFLGFKQWRALPFCANAETVLQEVIEDIMKWAEFGEMTLDEIIEFEMETWLDLDNIVSELGREIACVILQSLVCEVAVDLRDFKPVNDR